MAIPIQRILLLIMAASAFPAQASSLCALLLQGNPESALSGDYKKSTDAFRSVVDQTPAARKAEAIDRLIPLAAWGVTPKPKTRFLHMIAIARGLPKDSVDFADLDVASLRGREEIEAFFGKIDYQFDRREGNGTTSSRLVTSLTFGAANLAHQLLFYFAKAGPWAESENFFGVIGYFSSAIFLNAILVHHFAKETGQAGEISSLKALDEILRGQRSLGENEVIHIQRDFGFDHVDIAISIQGGEPNMDIYHWRFRNRTDP